jgi:hypothetical protein
MAVGLLGLLAAAPAVRAEPEAAGPLAAHYRGEIRGLEWEPAAAAPRPDDLDLPAMAKRALHYLRGNPDPARGFECKFSLGPLGIPCHVPFLPSNRYGHDPIALGDTDCRMDWQYPHMRQMAGEPQADDVERGVRRRIRSYQREDQLLSMNPAAWTGNLDSPSAVEALKYEWVSTWASGKLLYGLAEEFERSGDPKLKADCHALVRALGGLASRDAQGRAFFPHGASPWRNGEWLHLADAGIDKGWGAELSHGYPFVTAPLVRAWECTGDQEALDLARAFADGHIAGVQPDMGDHRIDPRTGAFRRHAHLHTHEIWGVASLGAATGEAKYLDWAERAYRFVLSQGTDYGWYPEYIPQAEYRAEICVVGDMTSIAANLARAGRPEFWDHVERTVRNTLRRSQFSLTPAFVALFKEVQRHRPVGEIEAALAQVRTLEGGFVAQPGLDDWVSYPAHPKLGTPGLYGNGIQMMGCCPPEGMRGLWEAWQGTVEDRKEGVFVNLALTRDHAAARVKAFRPEDGGLTVEAKRASDYFLRPPGWVERETVACARGGKAEPITWGGPADAYVVCRSVRAGENLRLTWAVPRFQQVFEPRSVPDRHQAVTVDWTGNAVRGVTPKGRYLPMYDGH